MKGCPFGKSSEMFRKASNLKQKVQSNPDTLALARNPAHLFLMIFIHANRPSEPLPRRRVLLYDRAIEIYLSSADESNDETHKGRIAQDRRRKRIARLALGMQMHDGGPATGQIASRETILEWLNDQHEGPTNEALLDTIVSTRGGLLTPMVNGYTFVHGALQEALAATALRDEIKTLQWARTESTARVARDDLRRWAGQSEWQETLAHLFAHLALDEESGWHEALMDCIFAKKPERLTTDPHHPAA